MTFRGKKVIGTIFYPVGLAIFLRNTKNLSCHEKKSSIARKNASLINTKKRKKKLFILTFNSILIRIKYQTYTWCDFHGRPLKMTEAKSVGWNYINKVIKIKISINRVTIKVRKSGNWCSSDIGKNWDLCTNSFLNRFLPTSDTHISGYTNWSSWLARHCFRQTENAHISITKIEQRSSKLLRARLLKTKRKESLKHPNMLQ